MRFAILLSKDEPYGGEMHFLAELEKWKGRFNNKGWANAVANVVVVLIVAIPQLNTQQIYSQSKMATSRLNKRVDNATREVNNK